MIELNLPNPSLTFLNTIQEVIKKELPNYIPGYNYLKPGRADGIYFFNHISDVGRNEYQYLFDEPLYVMVMIIRPDPWENSSTQFVNSCYPPHYDTERSMGLNYYIECGGDNVKTIMYSETKYDNIGMPIVTSYSNVNILREYCTQPNIWYAFEGSRYHSVENIESDRILISMSFKDLSYSTFCTKYKHLLKE